MGEARLYYNIIYFLLQALSNDDIRQYYDNSDSKLIKISKQESIESVNLINSEVKQSKQMIFILLRCHYYDKS